MQNTCSDEHSTSESLDMPNSHCLDLDLTTCSSSQYFNHENGLNSRGDSLQLLEDSENHFPFVDVSPIPSMNTPIFVGPDPCQGWEKTIQGLDRNTEDDTSLPCPEEKDGKLSLTVAENTNVISFLRKEYKDLCHIYKGHIHDSLEQKNSGHEKTIERFFSVCIL